ncbi:MAG: hypothetical protein GC147_13800 [Porphyrobacter sp.]|nr:hypothetical protein [Porphyrobacter sp.]
MLITLPKRRPKRVRVLLHCELETATGRSPARVRDVSHKGLLIEMTDPPGTGEAITVSYEAHRMAGTIIWRKGAWIGVKLDEALVPALWDELTGNPLRVAAPRRYRHDAIEEDEAQVPVTPRLIRLRRIGF